MYAQKLEGESWIGERMDTAKIDKMSGTASKFAQYLSRITSFLTIVINRSTTRPAIRAHASDSEAEG